MKKGVIVITAFLFLFFVPLMSCLASDQDKADEENKESTMQEVNLQLNMTEVSDQQSGEGAVEKIKEGEALLIVNDRTAVKEQLSFDGESQEIALTVGEEVYYEGWFTCYFYVGGNLAYCLEPLKVTPADGEYAKELVQNTLLGKALYYLYGGPGYNAEIEQAFFGEYGGDVSMIYGLSHAVLSFIYDGCSTQGGALTGLSDYGTQKVIDITEAIRSLPEPVKADIQIVPKTRNAFYAGNYMQQTEVQTVAGDQRNAVQFPILEKVTLHHVESGQSETQSGTLYGGESYYFTAPTEVMGTWEVENLYGLVDQDYQALIINKDADTQAVGGWVYTAFQGTKAAGFSVSWLGPIQIELKKQDSDIEGADAQGAGTLEGAVYHILDKNGQVADVLKTDIKGEAISKLLPAGEYSVREIEAPSGYLVSPDVLIPNNNMVIAKDEIIRGDVEIVKFGEDKRGEESEIKRPLQGIEFTFTSKSTGKTYQIVTDENGFASTKQLKNDRGGLAYDTYLLEETKGKEGYKTIDPIEVCISKQGETLHYIAEDKIIRAAVLIQKVDQATKEVIAIKGTEFRIIDESGNPVVMYTYYPKKEKHETYITDESGQILLPEKLDTGTYTLEEVKAPYGYLLGEPLQFEIKEAQGYDQPVTISYSNENAKGRLKILKVDEDTKEPIGQVTFEISAKEDVVSGDGTLHVKKGEVVDTICTDLEGTALSKELFLGLYTVKETKTPENYQKQDQEYEIELIYEGQTTPVSITEMKITNKRLNFEKEIVKTGDNRGRQAEAFVVMALTSALIGTLLILHRFTRK